MSCFPNKHYVLHIVVPVSSISHAASTAHAPYYIAICGLPAVPYFTHAVSKEAAIFWEKKIIQHKMYVSIICTSFFFF